MLKALLFIFTILFFNHLSAQEVAPVVSPMNVDPIAYKTNPDEKLDNPFEKTLTALAGVGYRQANWKYNTDKDNTHSNYEIRDAIYTSVEGDITFNKIFTKVGISISSEDEVIGDIQRMNGYLGYKNIMFRTETGEFQGHVDYRGFSTGNVTKRFNFDQKYSYSEAIYFFQDTPFFAGLRVTKWKLPIEVVALKKDQVSGQTVFDPDFEFSYTSISLGMDYMTQVMLNPKVFHSGWGVLGKVTGNYGWGTAQLGQSAITDANNIYGGGFHFTESKYGMLTAEMEASLGVMYTKGWSYMRMALGLGYNYNMFMLMSMAEEAKTSTELQPVTIVNFSNHGPIFRMQILF